MRPQETDLSRIEWLDANEYQMRRLRWRIAGRVLTVAARLTGRVWFWYWDWETYEARLFFGPPR